MGTAHRASVPYQVFDGADGKFVLASAIDGQFAKLCDVLGRPDLPPDPRFKTNVARVKNRDALIPILAALFEKFAGRALGRHLSPSACRAGTSTI